ncbi:hypothetical protein CVS48_05645 [Achromobacter spanius]|uniref:HD domain-containing protein n=1 Tax=Achromobacter spanius TaxID=217203 RepID=UPI000C2BD17F|nr:HD domain-containing protein [Achromobacter spanius]AUA55558.1 hypothetical protein CVS48_05645 [Achromobacter spanius]
MPPSPLESQLAFLREIDRLKTVVRQSPLLDRSRKENSAEHSWHLAMYALILESGVSLEQVLARYGPAIQRGAPRLWEECERWVRRHFQLRTNASSN